MEKEHIQYFGEIRMKSLEEYYHKNVQLNDKEISIDINFKKTEIDKKSTITIDKFLRAISEMDKLNVNTYSEDFAKNGETREYLEFYLEELPDEELEKLINTRGEKEDQRLELLNKLELVRVGLYPDGKYDSTYFGVFDYSIKMEGEFCDQLLVLKTTAKGEVKEICWES